MFNFPGEKGFAIVAGDDRVRPVLGYSDEGNFDPDNLPENLRGMLAYYQDQITWANDKGIEATPDIAAEWSRYTSGTALRAAGEPVLLNTARWNQQEPYNHSLPMARVYYTDGTSADKQAATGCVATASAIIMKYYEYPKSVTGGVSVFSLAAFRDPNNVSWNLTEHSYPVSYASYDWDLMKDEYVKGNYSEAEAKAVADLMWNIGANVEMVYGYPESGTNTQYAISQLTKVFGYSKEMRWVNKDYYYWADWHKMIRAEIDAKRPIIYSGRTVNNAGHAFVCDGYTDDNYYHINWGWGGYLNDYFLLTALSPDGKKDPYSDEMAMAINLRPAQAGDSGEDHIEIGFFMLEAPRSLPIGSKFDLKIRIKNNGNAPFAGSVGFGIVDATGKVVKRISSDGYGYWGENVLHVGYYTNEWSIPCTLSENLKEGERILPVYTIDKQTWIPMQGSHETALYIGPNGPVYADDDDPNPDVETHKIDLHLSNLITKEKIESIEDGNSLSLTLTCEKEGYRLPASITVTMGGEALEAGTGYTYNSESGNINIPAVTGDVVITATAELIPVVTYTISVGQVENMTSNLPLTVKEGDKSTTIVLNAKEGYLLPETVTVKAGDRELTAGTDYKYKLSPDRKVAEVTFEKVTSDLQLYALGVPEPKIFTIKQELSHLTSDKADEVKVAENSEQATHYTITLKPEANYKLPDAITILSGETQLTQGAEKDYTYDKRSGKVVVFKVTSDLMIKAVGIDASQIQVVLNLEGVVITSSDVKEHYEINSLPHFMLDLNAAEGYTYDGSIVVKMGDKKLDPNTDYDYVYENDSFELKVPLTATLTITAKGMKRQYTVTVTGTSLTPMEVPNTIAHGDPLSFKLVPDEGYDLPEVIEVKMGGTPLASTNYVYNKANGTISIAKVTGNVEVTAVAVAKTYEVKLNLTNLTSDFVSGTKVTHGKSLDIQLTAPADYKLPQAVTVLMNGKPAEHTYQNGKISITKVLGPIEITAKANKLYPVTENAEGVTIEGTENVEEGETFTAELEPNTGYHLPYAISVVMNGRLLSAGEYSYDNVSGKIEIPNVSGPLSISVKGVKEGHFEVVLNLVNLSSEPASFEPQAKDAKIELTLKPSSGYELPSGITVKMGNAPLATGTDYAYDRSTGKFTLEKITGTLVISANGSRIPEPEPEPEPEPTPVTYTVTLPVVEGATIAATGSTTVSEGSSLSFTVEVKAGYNADKMVVKANGTALTPDANGRYTIANIRSNVVVTVTGIVKGDDPTANETIDSDELRVRAVNGRLFIQTPVADTAYIVAFDGRVYKTLSLSVGEYTEAMPQGSYIIRVGKRSYKLNF